MGRPARRISPSSPPTSRVGGHLPRPSDSTPDSTLRRAVPQRRGWVGTYHAPPTAPRPTRASANRRAVYDIAQQRRVLPEGPAHAPKRLGELNALSHSLAVHHKPSPPKPEPRASQVERLRDDHDASYPVGRKERRRVERILLRKPRARLLPQRLRWHAELARSLRHPDRLRHRASSRTTTHAPGHAQERRNPCAMERDARTHPLLPHDRECAVLGEWRPEHNNSVDARHRSRHRERPRERSRRYHQKSMPHAHATCRCRIARRFGRARPRRRRSLVSARAPSPRHEDPPRPTRSTGRPPRPPHRAPTRRPRR